MSGVVPQLVIVAILILINAILAGTELALVSLRPSQLDRIEERGKTGALLASLARDPNRFLATIQIGITLSGALASATAAVTLAEPIEDALPFAGNAAGPISVVIVTLILTYLTLVFGELAPKRIAMQRAEGWAMKVIRPLNAMSVLTRPVVWLLSHSTNIVVRLLGGDPNLSREEVTDEELRSMIDAQVTFTEEHRDILQSAFEIANRTLREIVQPRGEVVVLDADHSVDEALDELVASGHSRAPVAPGADLDKFVGIVHLRDLVDRSAEPVANRTRDLMAFPETVIVIDAITALQEAHQQMAVVINEHGGSEGIVTLEDLIEELVGDIRDEADPDISELIAHANGEYEFTGRFPIHELDDFEIDLPTGDYSTIAGLVLSELGRIPEGPGDVITVNNWRIEVLAVSGRTVDRVLVTKIDDDEDEPTAPHSVTEEL